MVNYPEQVIIKTDGGIFNLKINPQINRDTQIIESYFISLDSKTNKCVQLSVPSIESTLKTGTLSWVKAEDDCSLEKYIEKGLAKHMVLLALTLARDINPLLERINLDDMSTFTCELPDNKMYKIPMKSFHIAFHGATWYEYYFDAKLVKYNELYCKLKENLYDSDKKPKNFNFNNEYLQEELEQLYNNSNTWSDFFSAIDKNYGKKKCGVVYPWLYRAMTVIFEHNKIFENENWYIDLKENAKKDKTALIPFKSYEPKQGGKRQTRKRKYKFRGCIPYIYFIDIPEIAKMNYKKFLYG